MNKILYQIQTEKLLSFTIGNIRFIDSLAFLIESWDNIMQNLYDNDNDDKNKHFNDMKKRYGEHFDLMCKKGIYSYAWVTSFDKMDYVDIPPVDAFCSSLKQETASK